MDCIALKKEERQSSECAVDSAGCLIGDRRQICRPRLVDWSLLLLLLLVVVQQRSAQLAHIVVDRGLELDQRVNAVQCLKKHAM